MSLFRRSRGWPCRLWLAAAVAVAGCGAALLWPRRYVVDGPSMAPGLLPGDVVATDLLPLRDRFTAPARFDRWVLAAADGTPVIKRVVGLPGDMIAFHAGDLAIDGETILKEPRLLAGMGSRVPDDQPGAGGAAGGTAWSRPAGEVLDDEPRATAGTMLLVPVRDVGLAAIVHVVRSPAAGAVRVRARVAATAVTWRLRSAGRYACVAGRLDGRLVAAAWPLPSGHQGDACPPRSCLPVAAPDRWHASAEWPAGAVGDDAPALAVELLHDTAVEPATATIEDAWRWRDVHHRPAADGRTRWRLGSGEVFVLGDFPAGSRDSRHWGPLPLDSLRHRIR